MEKTHIENKYSLQAYKTSFVISVIIGILSLIFFLSIGVYQITIGNIAAGTFITILITAASSYLIKKTLNRYKAKKIHNLIISPAQIEFDYFFKNLKTASDFIPIQDAQIEYRTENYRAGRIYYICITDKTGNEFIIGNFYLHWKYEDIEGIYKALKDHRFTFRKLEHGNLVETFNHNTQIGWKKSGRKHIPIKPRSK